MTQLQKIELKTLVNILSAYSAHYGRDLTEEEMIDCAKTISFLEKEIETRRNLLGAAKEMATSQAGYQAA